MPVASLERRRRDARLGLLLDAAGRAGLFRSFGDGFGHGGCHAFVEDGGDYVVLGELLLGDDVGHGVGGGELHALVDLVGADVKGAAEDTGEAEDVVDLVRVVAAAGGDDPGVPHRDLGAYLRVGVGHGEDYRVLVHGLEVLDRKHVRGGEAEEEVGAPDGLGEISGAALGVGVLGEPALGGVQVLAALVDDALGVAADDVRGACGHDDLGARNAGGADAVDHHAQVLERLTRDLEGVYERRQHDDRRAVLVVVEDGDVEFLLEALLDLEAPRRRDVLEVDPPEAGRQVLDGLDYLLGVLGVKADGEGVHVRELLEEGRLALHHGHRRPGSYVPEAEHRGPVRDDGDRVALDGQVEGALGVLVDRAADPGNTRRVDHREVVAGPDLELRADLDLAPDVHEERPVGDVDDLDVGQPLDGLDDPLAVLGVAGVDGYVADGPVLAHPDDVHGPDQPVGLADDRQDLAQRPRPVRKLDPQREAVARARYGFHEVFLSLVSPPHAGLPVRDCIARPADRARGAPRRRMGNGRDLGETPSYRAGNAAVQRRSGRPMCCRSRSPEAARPAGPAARGRPPSGC